MQDLKFSYTIMFSISIFSTVQFFKSVFISSSMKSLESNFYDKLRECLALDIRGNVKNNYFFI